jgi:3-oxoacyl-[acyl-carrier-protein] synthase-1
VREHEFMIDMAGNPLRAAVDELLEPKTLGGARLATLARSALAEALGAMGPRWAPSSIPIDVLLAVPESRPGFTDTNAAWLAREVTRDVLPPPIARHAELAARGHAGALDAIREACARIEDGRAEIVAVVGVDSYLSPDTIDWLDENRQIHGERSRSGFLPGEAAGCVVVAGGTAASHLGLPTLARVRGAASAREARVIKGDEEVLGHGLTRAVLDAARSASLRLPEQAVDEVYCDINGERYRTDEWTFTLLRVSQLVREVRHRFATPCWGDVGAATGALNCILATRAWARGYAKGPRALVWCSSEGGLRSAVVLEEPQSLGGAVS